MIEHNLPKPNLDNLSRATNNLSSSAFATRRVGWGGYRYHQCMRPPETTARTEHKVEPLVCILHQSGAQALRSVRMGFSEHPTRADVWSGSKEYVRSCDLRLHPKRTVFRSPRSEQAHGRVPSRIAIGAGNLGA